MRSQGWSFCDSTDDAASGGDEGGGVSTRQSIMAETDYDPWPEIEAQAAALAGPGASVTAAPSSASLLVSGTPRDVDRVRTWLAWLNREVLRPVTLSVHVYAVRMEREADYGFGLAALVKELFGTSAELAVTPESVAIVRPSAAVGDTLAATVRALSRAGTVSRVLSADIPSLNGKPAQFVELYKEAYVKEQRTTAGEGIAQTEIVPGTVSSGFRGTRTRRLVQAVRREAALRQGIVQGTYAERPGPPRPASDSSALERGRAVFERRDAPSQRRQIVGHVGCIGPAGACARDSVRGYGVKSAHGCSSICSFTRPVKKGESSRLSLRGLGDADGCGGGLPPRRAQALRRTERQRGRTQAPAEREREEDDE